MEFLALAGIGLLALYGWKRLRLLEEAKQIVHEQQQMLRSCNGIFRADIVDMQTFLSDYFREQTFGASGRKWRINNEDKERGRLVCDFETVEDVDEYISLPMTAATFRRDHTDITIGETQQVRTISVSRYVCLRVELQPGSDAGTTGCKLDWEFRNIESGMRSPIPSCMWSVCAHFLHALRRRFIMLENRSSVLETSFCKPEQSHETKISRSSPPVIPLLFTFALCLIGGLCVFVSFQGKEVIQTSNSKKNTVASTGPEQVSDDRSLTGDERQPSNNSAMEDYTSQVFNDRQRPSGTALNEQGEYVKRMLLCQQSGDETGYKDAESKLESLTKPDTGDTEQATELNQAGLKALKAKNYEEAAAQFALAGSADPSDPKYLSNLGYAEMYLGDLDSAETHLYASLSLGPSRSVAWGDLGLVLARKGDLERAAASFLIGHKVSTGESLGFIKSLQTDDSEQVRQAGALALSKLDQFGNAAAPAAQTGASVSNAGETALANGRTIKGSGSESVEMEVSDAMNHQPDSTKQNSSIVFLEFSDVEKTKHDRGATLVCRYPQFSDEGPASPQQVRQLNSAIESFVERELTKLARDASNDTISSANSQLAPSRDKFESQFEIGCATDKLVSIALEFDCWTGGVQHASFFTKPFNYRLSPFERVTLSDISSDAAMKVIKVIAAREAKSEITFHFGESLTGIDNFSVTKDGLEIRDHAGAWGSNISNCIKIPAQALKPTLDNSSVLLKIWTN